MKEHWFSSRIRSFKVKPCITESDTTYSYQDLVNQIEAFKTLIQATNIPKGSIVTLVADYSLKSIAALLGLMEEQMITALASQNTEGEIQKKVEASKSEWKINLHPLGSQNFERTELSLPSRSTPIKNFKQKGKAGFIIFTSGSTGEPKAILHDFENFIETYKERKVRNLNFLALLLFDHIGGLNTLFSTLSSGARIVLPKDRNPTTIAESLEHYKINIPPTSSSFLNLMLLQGAFDERNLNALRIITYGTEPMPEGVLKKLR